MISTAWCWNSSISKPDSYSWRKKDSSMPQNRKTGAPVLAADIGGTKILTALFSPGGKMLARNTGPTLAEEGADAVIGRLGAAFDNLLKQNSLKPVQLGGIGIACAGGIDSGRGMVVTPSPNMPGWTDIPLAEIVSKKFKVKTYLINDASAAALGEHRHGAGKGADNLVLLTVGTGIGGGIIINGNLYLGEGGGAGELGHMTIDDSGPECGCGNRGCLEMLASGMAVARQAKKLVREGGTSALTVMADGNIDSITAEMVEAAARQADKTAQEIIDRAAYYLGVGMVNIVNIFNPEMIIIGGGMAAMGDMLIGPGRKMVKERAFSVSSQGVSIVTAQLGNDAGVYGAAVFTLEKRLRGSDEST
jgi:glucokinase